MSNEWKTLTSGREDKAYTEHADKSEDSLSSGGNKWKTVAWQCFSPGRKQITVHKELCSKFLSEQQFHSESKNELVNSRAALQEALWKNLKQNVNEIR